MAHISFRLWGVGMSSSPLDIEDTLPPLSLSGLGFTKLSG